jgi:hypothetical protein
MSSTVTHADVKRRFDAMSEGMSAAPPIRGSITPKVMISPADSASIATTRQSPHPQSADWSSATRSSKSPADREAMPP